MTTISSESADRGAVFVLKLHRDADPAGRLHGRAIHLDSGVALRFDDAHALLAWLHDHANATASSGS